MQTSLIVLFYILGIGSEVGMLFVKWKGFLSVPAIVFSIVFLCTRDSMWLWIGIIDLIIAALGICASYISTAIREKNKKPSLEDKTRIEDL